MWYRARGRRESADGETIWDSREFFPHFALGEFFSSFPPLLIPAASASAASTEETDLSRVEPTNGYPHHRIHPTTHSIVGGSSASLVGSVWSWCAVRCFFSLISEVRCDGCSFPRKSGFPGFGADKCQSVSRLRSLSSTVWVCFVCAEAAVSSSM